MEKPHSIHSTDTMQALPKMSACVARHGRVARDIKLFGGG